MTTIEQLRPNRVLEVAPTSWWDPQSECTLTIAEPAAVPDLFAEYHRGAVASYARFGVENAIDADAGRCADDTALFWAMTDLEGRVIGGVRAKGPLLAPDDSHAVVEWQGRPGEDAVRDMIAERIPFGVVELKAAWVSGDGARNRYRAKLIARCGFHALAMLGIDYFMATSAPHVLEQWRSSGGVVASIPATPYPDARYETKMMWWDRRTFAVHGDAEQVASTIAEMARIHRRRPPGPISPRALGALSSHPARAGRIAQGREDSYPGA